MVTSNDVTGQHVVMTTGEVAEMPPASRTSSSPAAKSHGRRRFQRNRQRDPQQRKPDPAPQTGTTEVCTFVEQFADDVDVGVAYCFALNGKPVARIVPSRCERCCRADGSRSAVRPDREWGEQFVTHRIVNHSNFSAAFERTAIDTAKCGRRLIKLVVPSVDR